MLSYLVAQVPLRPILDSLNPCSNGICSLTGIIIIVLVAMCSVLILVLMEYALLQRRLELKSLGPKRLNPCSNGICSLTVIERAFDRAEKVLILVLMEYALLQVICIFI